MKNIQDDRGYNQVFKDVESTRIRAERRCNFMISEMDLHESTSVMEIGCGMGGNCFSLARKTGMNVLGTDLCVSFIAEAKKHFQLPNLRYEVLDFNQADQFEGERFDYIVGNGILHHLYHQLDEALVKMRGLLKSGGRIIFLEPNIRNPYVYLIFSYPALRAMVHLEPDEMAFSKAFITAKLQQSGYSNIRVKYKDFLLPGISAALVGPSIFVGRVLEKLPVLKYTSQSIYIVADGS